MKLLLLFPAAYLLGSVPTALWISRLFFGIDIREHGSKNMGATNTFRVLGPVYGVVVLVVDMLKAVAAVQLVRLIGPGDWLWQEKSLWQLLFGLTAVTGHIFPVFAGFRGGKGVACLFGTVLAIQPWIALASVVAFLLVVVLTRYVSLGSLAGAAVFVVCVWFAWNDPSPYLRWFSFAAAVCILVLHRGNLQRLIKGTEGKISLRSKRRKKD